MIAQKEMTQDTFYEIVDLTIDLTTVDPEEKEDLVDFLYSIARELGYKEVVENIQDYRIKNDKCPVCREELISVGTREDRGECFGFPSYETIYKLECEFCGWEEE